MDSAIATDPSNPTLYLQLLDLLTSGHTPPDMTALDTFFKRVDSYPDLPDPIKESFLARRQQLLEEFGGGIDV